jgi:hypothetical protein
MKRVKIIILTTGLFIICLLIFNIVSPNNIRFSFSKSENGIYSSIIDKAVSHVIDVDLKQTKVVIKKQTLQNLTNSEYRINPALLYEPAFKSKAIYTIGKYISVNNFIDEETLKNIKYKMPLLQFETLEDYQSKNKYELEIKDNFICEVKYQFVNKEEIEAVFNKEGGWSEFSKAFPGSIGYLSMSKIGFNKIENQALVYTEFWCGGLCGEGAYWLLLKSNNKWVLEQKITTWLS